MKNVKKVLAATALSGAVLVGAGFGTYSWFTSSAQTSGTINNGTLTLNNNQNFPTTIVNGTQFAPSQLYAGNWLTINNTGSLGSILKGTYTQSVNQGDLSKYKVGYIAVKYTETPSSFQLDDWRTKNLCKLFSGTTNVRWDSLGGLNTPQKAAATRGDSSSSQTVTQDGNYVIASGLLTPDQVQGAASANAVNANGANPGVFHLGNGDKDSFWQLNSGQSIAIIFGVKMDESAGNDNQGAIYTSNVKFDAKQTDDGAQFSN